MPASFFNEADPTVAADLAAHVSDTSVHGIEDTSVLATDSDVASAVAVEATARASAVTAEATARASADSALDSRVDALETAPPDHGHVIDDVSGLQSALDGRATDSELASEASSRAAADSALDTRVDALELAPPDHPHVIADVTGLQTALDGRATDAELSTEASTRAAADTALDGRVDALEAAPPAHTHDDRYFTETESDTRFVLASDTQATGTAIEWIIERTNASRPAGEASGFWSAFKDFNGVIDPIVGMGHNASNNRGSSWQLERAWRWDSVQTNEISEIYWQVTKSGDGSTWRRPIYGKYDMTLERAISWDFMIGAGITDDSSGAEFSVGWDDDTTPTGAACFKVKANRVNLYPVTTGGISADRTRFNLYSTSGQGSAVSWTHGGLDAEGTTEPTFVMQTASATQIQFYGANRWNGAFFKGSQTQPVLRLNGALQLSDGTPSSGAGASAYSALWSTTGAPDSAMGANGDFAFRQDGTLGKRRYFKTAGAWVTDDGPKIVAQSGVAAALTGTTSETALATVTIPAGTIGANGRVRVTATWSYTNSANNKTARIRFGGIGGTAYHSQVATTTAAHKAQVEIANRNATNSQIGGHAGGQGGFGVSSGAVVTGTHDTTVDQTVVISGQLANTGETITLESYVVELLP